MSADKVTSSSSNGSSIVIIDSISARTLLGDVAYRTKCVSVLECDSCIAVSGWRTVLLQMMYVHLV